MVAVLVTALLAFASTNVDDMFVLLVLYGQGRRPAMVALGQYLGFGAIVVVSLVVSAGALLLPPQWAGFLGVAPAAIGVKGLLSLRRRASEPTAPAGAKGVLAVAAVTFANGGDNVAVYGPLFARRSWTELALMLMVFAVLLAAWCATAYRLTRFPWVASAFGRWGHWIAPFVLIGLGIYLFVDAGAAAYVLDRLHRP